jgi:hypothetical protein
MDGLGLKGAKDEEVQGAGVEVSGHFVCLRSIPDSLRPKSLRYPTEGEARVFHGCSPWREEALEDVLAWIEILLASKGIEGVHTAGSACRNQSRQQGHAPEKQRNAHQPHGARGEDPAQKDLDEAGEEECHAEAQDAPQPSFMRPFFSKRCRAG